MSDHAPLILLVEDNLYDVLLVQRALKTAGLTYQLEVVTDGQEALDFLRCEGEHQHRESSDNPYLVLLDVHLPKLSGLEILKIIRHTLRLAHIPVIILSESDHDPSVREGYERGANSYVCKSVDTKKFAEDIQNVVHYWLILNKQPKSIQRPSEEVSNDTNHL